MKNIQKKDLRVEQTCEAYPEQYEVFFDEKQVGYFRLRWGCFDAVYPDHTGYSVYYATTIGDGLTGQFTSEEERQYHLDKAIDAILRELND
jgi:hypothetical protein